LTLDERLRRYAELTVRVGANVQEGQDVVVSALVEHAAVARAISREAYRAGAKHVIVLYRDLHVRRAAIELGPEDELDWSPPYLLDWFRRFGDEHPAFIALTGDPDPELLVDLDPVRVGKAVPRELNNVMFENLRRHRLNWVVVAAPNEAWARQVFG
jgi:aminopeptidase